MNTPRSILFAFPCKAMEGECLRPALHSAQSNATDRVFSKCDLQMTTGTVLKTQAHFGGLYSVKVTV